MTPSDSGNHSGASKGKSAPTHKASPNRANQTEHVRRNSAGSDKANAKGFPGKKQPYPKRTGTPPTNYASVASASISTATVTPSPHDPGATHAQPHEHFPNDPVTASMEDFLSQAGCYETQRGLFARKEALKQLNVLVKQWIQSVCMARSLDTRLVERMGGRIVTYGSYMLGISHQGADIDALCLAPKIITREEYFSSFFKFLSFQDEVSELRSIEEAFVPVIKMRFNDIEIDMTFAQLDMECVPPEDDFLRNISPSGLDPKCLRSLNGFRSTQELLRLVPDLPTFRVTLRAIKLWAKNQGLYSNTLGFLGGFSWATLVAKTCQLHPNLTPSQTVQKFFHTFSTWQWPAYVSLVDLEETATAAANVMGSILAPAVPAAGAGACQLGQQQQMVLTSWNPEKYMHDKMQAMPIITPTFPHINSTFNVSANTLRLIQRKLAEAARIVDGVLAGVTPWDFVFEMKHVLDEAQEFLLLMASAKADASVQWFGLIESKIRHFITGLELSSENRLDYARIWPKPWRNKGKGDTINLVWFVGIEHGHDVNLSNIDTMPYTRQFLTTLSSHAAKFKTDDMSFKVHSITKAELYERLSPQELNTLISCQSYNHDLFPEPPQEEGPGPNNLYSSPAGSPQNSPHASSSPSSSKSSQQQQQQQQRRPGKVGRPGGKRTNSQGSSGYGSVQTPVAQTTTTTQASVTQMAQQQVNGMGFFPGHNNTNANGYSVTVYARVPQSGGLSQQPHSHGANNLPSPNTLLLQPHHHHQQTHHHHQQQQQQTMFPFPPNQPYGKHHNGGVFYPNAAPMYNHLHPYPTADGGSSGGNNDFGGTNRDLKTGRKDKQHKIRKRKDAEAARQLSLALQSQLVRDLKLPLCSKAPCR